MSGVKSGLKAAKAALDAQDWDGAISHAKDIIGQAPNNYFAHVFLGRALEKQDKADQAIDAYQKASSIEPNGELAWKGLCNVYESLGSKGVEGLITASVELAKVYEAKDERDQCQTVIDKLISFAKEHGSRKLYKQALGILLPTSPVYDYLEGRIQPASLTYIRLAELTELEEKDRINKEVGERRTRLGAKLGQVTSEVKSGVYGASEVESLYQHVIDWTQDDDTRRVYEEKSFERAYEHMSVLPMEAKGEKRDQVMQMARDMVVIKHPLQSAWTLDLEWKDVEELAHLDIGVLREYVAFFPKSGLGKVLQAYLGEKHKAGSQQHVNGDSEGDSIAEERDTEPLVGEDRLKLLTEGLEESSDSAFAHRIVSDYYLGLEEYESCADISKKGLSLLQQLSAASGLHFQRNQDAMSSNLATSLVYYQAPKNHPEAKDIFNDILKRKPTATTSLLGLGLILEEQEDYEAASTFLKQASKKDPENLRISTEAAWCLVLTGDTEGGLASLEASLPTLEKSRMRELKALTLYRIGRCLWELHPDKNPRKDRHGAYARFIASLKADPNLAPAYTSLGIYYSDYSRDKKRARQCFQKAFELSATEVVAAERLARAFADDADWDIVEVVAQQVVDTGVARPAPGSKKRGISWPFSALGIVQMTRQAFPQAIVSFQAALRISPKDYYSWVGLGESYHSSGRYIAAQKTLEHAKTLAKDSGLENDTWFAEYMLSNVLRELSDFNASVDGYNNVLKERPDEFGLSLALLQTLVERAISCVETGFFGLAAESAKSALEAAAHVVQVHDQSTQGFNVWKAIADALAIFASVPGLVTELPLATVKDLLARGNINIDEELIKLDQISQNLLSSMLNVEDAHTAAQTDIAHCASLLAYKQAVTASSTNVHAQAVAWYNLGWMETKVSHQTRTVPRSRLKPKLLARASIRCFKRAIELEAGNADFWNALGVATTTLNPSVAQHSFVRSLHLNERSARTWTNLGTLYLTQGDYELAHNAFARSQSTDPEYPCAWVGEGLIAAHLGNEQEAVAHFLHAADIADDSTPLVKARYTVSTFDVGFSASLDSAQLVQPIFALQQLLVQAPFTDAYRHLLALLQERVGDFSAAANNFTKVAANSEAHFEETEDPDSLARFARSKADLARISLAFDDHALAAEHAEVALDLTSEPECGNLGREQRRRLRLSAHITAGLAHYFLQAMDESVAMFKEALAESDSSPEVVCLLAQVLWAKGGEEETGVARDQLFECIEKHPGHPQATSLIGAMSAMEDDEATLEAVAEDLQTLRTSNDLSRDQQRHIEALITALAALTSKEDESAATAKASIMLAPEHPDGWSLLAEACGDDEVARASTLEMAAMTGSQSVPPIGTTTAPELAKNLAGTGKLGDTQRAIALSPWLVDAWEGLSVG